MSELPLIVGGGPVGLAAAVFLTQKQSSVRIIDKLVEQSPHSKALTVNPRTLELLEPTGVTQRMLQIGKRINAVTFWGNGKPVARMNMSDLPHKYPFMLALSQGTSERLLEEALVAAGGRLERGIEMTACRTLIGNVEATLGEGEIVRAPWLFAADGSRSTVRHGMKIDFKGSAFDVEWSLVDVPMQIELAEDHAHIVFLPAGGFLFCMRVVGDGSDASPLPLWRIMGNVTDPLARLSQQFSLHADLPVWSSSFHIAHRIASKLQIDKICLGGDAAHIHSPAGARGMNLGIEDGWEFSQRVMRGMLAGYGNSRRPIDLAVVRRINLVTRMARGESIAARLVRSILLPIATDISPLRLRILKTMTGLDHALSIN